MDGDSLFCPITKTWCYFFSIYKCLILPLSSHPMAMRMPWFFFAYNVLYDALVPILSCLYFYLPNILLYVWVKNIFLGVILFNLWSKFLFWMCVVIMPKYGKTTKILESLVSPIWVLGWPSMHSRKSMPKCM